MEGLSSGFAVLHRCNTLSELTLRVVVWVSVAVTAGGGGGEEGREGRTGRGEREEGGEDTLEGRGFVRVYI